MYYTTTSKPLHPVDSEVNRQFLLMEGVEPTRLVSPAGQAFDEYPLRAGVVVPLKQVAFYDDQAQPEDPLSSSINLKRLYYRNLGTGELLAVDVSLMPDAKFVNQVPCRPDTLSVRLEYAFQFPGESSASRPVVMGQVDRDTGLLQMAATLLELPSGVVLQLAGYEILAARVVKVLKQAA